MSSPTIKRVAGQMVSALMEGPLTRADLVERIGVSAPTVNRAIRWCRECGIWIQSDSHRKNKMFGGWSRAGLYSLSARGRQRVQELRSMTVGELAESAGAPAWALMVEASRAD